DIQRFFYPQSRFKQFLVHCAHLRHHYTTLPLPTQFSEVPYIKTCQDAMQIFGAYGYSKEYGIERELRDAMACSIYSGTSEIMRNTIFQLLSI
ncbi:MAG: acyl-CoA/acyl-ACP dehydrogenase, partial [Bacteroidales bacterium]|nr:acyl-CoA/acyl-ACP dehydrogenase [Bacteroidales bacterium]